MSSLLGHSFIGFARGQSTAAAYRAINPATATTIEPDFFPATSAEAEKACAEMTSYSPEKLLGKSAETQALTRREYELCVTSVATDDPATAEAPALRGRSNTP